MTNVKILKLSSGEEVICNINTNEKEHIKINRPMKLNAYPKMTRNGSLEESLSLQRWIHFSETDTYDVPKSQIIVVTQASYGLTKFYEYCVTKMKMEEEDVELPTDEELMEIEEEDLFEDFDVPSTTVH
jgi:hypothetical protein